MSKPIALFGATGNVGKELLKVLQADENARGPFFVVTRSSGGDGGIQTSLQLDKDRFRFVTFSGDYTQDTDALVDALKGVETAFVCVPQLLVHKAKEYIEPLSDLLVKASVRHVVKVGTGEPEKYEYGRRHLQAEQALKDKGLQLTVLNGGEFSSNPDYLGPAPTGAPYCLIDLFKGVSYLSYLNGSVALKGWGNFPSLYSGDVKLAFMDLRDFADAFKVVLLDPSKHTGKVYQICSEPLVSMRDVANIYGELLGRTFHVIHVKDENERKDRLTQDFGEMERDMMEIAMDCYQVFEETGCFTGENWTGLKELTGQHGRTFRAFAEERVRASWKPVPIPL